MLQREPLFPVKDNFAPYRNVKSVLEIGNPENIKNPKVSIVVPIYNHPEYLEETLMSVINQDYQEEFEIIVVDNNMTQPHSPNYDIIKNINSPKVLYYRHKENIKFEGNCNRGVELARAEYVSFCHDDDLLLPDALSTLMQIQKETGEKCIVADYGVIDKKSCILYKPVFPYKHHFLLRRRLYYNETKFWLLHRCATLQIGSLWSKRKFIACGGYSEGQAPCQDFGIHAIYTCLYGGVHCNKPTFMYRIANNASKDLYRLFPERNEFIMGDLISQISFVPKCYLNIMKSYNNKRVHNGNEKTWGDNNRMNIKKYSHAEKIVAFINNILLKIKVNNI